MLSTDGARALAGVTHKFTPHPRLLEMQLADFRTVITREAESFAGLDLERQIAVWKYGAELRIDAFNWTGKETALEAFAAELARVVDEGIEIRRSNQ